MSRDQLALSLNLGIFRTVKQTINKGEVKLTEEKGVGWGSASLPNDWFVGLRYVNRVKCVKQTINKGEVKLTEVNGVGWGSAPIPYDWYVEIRYVNRVKCVKQTINEREVKLTEENGVGWGSASIPYDWYVGIRYVNKVKCVKQSGISLNLRTGPTGHATLFNQWEGALVSINKQIKTSPQWSKIFKTTDGVGQN